MRRLLLAIIATLAFSGVAHATCPATLMIKDATGTNYTAKYIDDGSGNCLPNAVVGGLTVGGITPKMLNALSNSPVAIKGSQGQLLLLQCGNTNTGEAYVQVFNTLSGSVSIGSTVPVLSIPIAGSSTGGFALSLTGIQFGTAITVAATTTATGGTAPSTALDCNAGYN